MRIGAMRDGVRHWLALALVLLLMPTLVCGQGLEIHGESSVFAGQGVAIAWGVLKGATEEQSQVVVRIVPTGAAFAAIRIEGVDPFTQNHHVFIDGQPLGDHVDVWTLRGTFADFPRREIRLYRTDADWKARTATVTIFYLGLPDTTPEFISRTALFTYLDQALARIQGAGQGQKP